MRKTELKRRSSLRSSGRPTGRKRKPSEFARIYGSKARVAWVKSLPCLVCNSISPLFGIATMGRSHNAHTENGGMGRKAHYTTIIPLCASHHRCYDEHLFPLAERETRSAAKAFAAKVEAMWLAASQGTPTRTSESNHE